MNKQLVASDAVGATYVSKIAISIPVNILESVDRAREDIPRSLFIVRILEQHFKGGGK